LEAEGPESLLASYHQNFGRILGVNLASWSCHFENLNLVPVFVILQSIVSRRHILLDADKKELHLTGPMLTNFAD
jgi:hypothetical protein